MEVFNKYKAVKLRSHLNKYLVADEEKTKVRQSRRGVNTRNSRWTVENVENKPHVIRLKSCHGLYLTATDMSFLLGATGEKILATEFDKGTEWKFEFEPIKDGFQIKFRTWCNKYLRANGGPPPWRNSVTHDDPMTSSTRNWILWDVEGVEGPVNDSVSNLLLSQQSSFSSFNSDEMNDGTEYGSPVVVSSPARTPKTTSSFSSKRSLFSGRSPWNSSKVSSSKQPTVKPITSNKFRVGMDLFHNAKAVRLRSHHDKYLLAEDDEEFVTQGRNGSSKTAKWTVELVPGSESVIRLKSCFGKYLTASNQPFLLGMTGRKVLQTLPSRLDSSVEWEPVREGNNQVRLKTRYGNFLRANGGLPPWRNSVTHDVPHRTATQDWVLWEVDIVEIQVQSPAYRPAGPPPLPHSDSLDFEDPSSSRSSVSHISSAGSYDRQESNDSFVESTPKMEGRTIYYHIAEDNGDVDDEAVQGCSMIFKGNGVEELTRKLEEETGIEGIVVCTRSPLNGQLFPLRLQLPPNNVTINVVVVLSSSKAAEDLEKKGLL